MQLSKATVNRLHLRKSNAHVFADWRRSFEDIWIISYTTKSLCMCVMEIYCHCLGRKTVPSGIQIRFDWSDLFPDFIFIKLTFQQNGTSATHSLSIHPSIRPFCVHIVKCISLYLSFLFSFSGFPFFVVSLFRFVECHQMYIAIKIPSNSKIPNWFKWFRLSIWFNFKFTSNIIEHLSIELQTKVQWMHNLQV